MYLYVIIGCVVCTVIGLTLALFYCIRACSRAEAERARNARKEHENEHGLNDGEGGVTHSFEDGVRVSTYSFEDEKSRGGCGDLVEIDVYDRVQLEDEGSPAAMTRKNIEMHNKAHQSRPLCPPVAPGLPGEGGEVWKPVFSERFMCMGWQSMQSNAVVYKMPLTGTILQPVSSDNEANTPPPSRRRSVRREREAGED